MAVKTGDRTGSKEYADGIGVPVIQGMGCAVAMAEAWGRLGTPYSRVRYPGGIRDTALALCENAGATTI